LRAIRPLYNPTEPSITTLCSIAQTVLQIENMVVHSGKGIFRMTPQNSTDWRHLAERASKEMDPEKLMSLVNELNRVLEQNEKSSRGRTEENIRTVV
jgi:hypothetical protein